MKNILFIHGLESNLSEAKKEILQRFGNVYHPEINYFHNEEVINTLSLFCKEKNIDYVVGSSIGGFVAFYLAHQFNIPTLLFNPALLERSVNQIIPAEIKPTLSYKNIILGILDQVVPNQKVFQFLAENPKWNTSIDVVIENEMEHRVPLDIFNKSVKNFFKQMHVNEQI